MIILTVLQACISSKGACNVSRAWLAPGERGCLLDGLEEGLCVGGVVDACKGGRAQQEAVQDHTDGKVEAQEICDVLHYDLAEKIAALGQVVGRREASPGCACSGALPAHACQCACHPPRARRPYLLYNSFREAFIGMPPPISALICRAGLP